MNILTGKCQNCGGTIQFNDNINRGFCQYCGTPFIAQEIIQNIKQDIRIDNATIYGGGPTEQNLILRMNEFMQKYDYYSAVEYANKILDINPNNMEARNIAEKTFFICNTYLTLAQVKEIEAVLSNPERAKSILKKHTNAGWGADTKTIEEWNKRGLNAIIFKQQEKLRKQQEEQRRKQQTYQMQQQAYQQPTGQTQQPKKQWKDMTKGEKRLRLFLAIGLPILIPLSILFSILLMYLLSGI